MVDNGCFFKWLFKYFYSSSRAAIRDPRVRVGVDRDTDKRIPEVQHKAKADSAEIQSLDCEQRSEQFRVAVHILRLRESLRTAETVSDEGRRRWSGGPARRRTAAVSSSCYPTAGKTALIPTINPPNRRNMSSSNRYKASRCTKKDAIRRLFEVWWLEWISKFAAASVHDGRWDQARVAVVFVVQ